MRGNINFALCFFVMAILFLSGFLATPSLFHRVNFEYQLVVPDLIKQKEYLIQQTRQDETRRFALEGDVQRFESLNAAIYTSSGEKIRSEKYASGSNFAIEKDAESKSDSLQSSSKKIDVYKIPNLTENLREKLDETQMRLQSFRREIDQIREINAKRQADVKEIDAKISQISTESNNAYLVTRALSLGAIGALISLFSKNMTGVSDHFFFERLLLRKIAATLAVGGTVSVVALGLFYTKQISIFHNSDNAIVLPDYWRTTILCLMSGAFADRLFNAASGRIDQYIGSRDETKKHSDQPDDIEKNSQKS